MTVMTFRGVHSTCLTQAESIVNSGARVSAAGRAGTGFYLWSYSRDSEEAEALARDWYQDQKDDGAYKSFSKQAMVILFYEISLNPLEFLNINSTWHHEQIRKKYGRTKDKAGLSKAYDDHISGIAQDRFEQKKVHLKLIEATLPVPSSTRERSRGVPLTVGADAYIVLPAGLPNLRLTDAIGMSLKGA